MRLCWRQEEDEEDEAVDAEEDVEEGAGHLAAQQQIERQARLRHDAQQQHRQEPARGRPFQLEFKVYLK